jgi:hypothetical protein
MASNIFERSVWIGTHAEQVALIPNVFGSIFFETDTDDAYWWNGAAWIAFGGGGGGGCLVCDVTNTYGGDGSFASHTTATYCTVVGYNALNADTTGHHNVAIGAEALLNNISGNYNIAVGAGTLYNNTSNSNVAIGNKALYTNDTGNSNIAVGTDALYYNETGSGNIALGGTSLHYNIDGDHNIAIGIGALEENRTGGDNVSIGYHASQENITGDWNTAVGLDALQNNVTGYDNSAFGDGALLQVCGTYDDISAFADYSGTVAGTVKATSAGHGFPVGTTDDVSISGSAFYNGVYTITYIDANNFYFTHVWSGNDTAWWSMDIEGRNNVGVGTYSGYMLQTGSENTFIGFQTGYDVSQKTDAFNSMALGANTYTTKDNQVVLGDDNIVETLIRGLTGVNETTIAAQLDVCQSESCGAIPVLELDQDDEDETFINYVGTSAADQAHSISTVNGDGAVDGPKNYSSSAGWTFEGMVKIDINGSPYWMPYYSIDNPS